MSNFLDQTGLAYFWQKIKTLLSGKLGTSETAHKTSSIPMGKVDSTSTSTAFTATVDGITELRNGVCMWLTNGIVDSASGFTININNLGAKPVYSSMAAATRITTVFHVDYTMLFVYNETRVSGGCWDCVYGYYINTNTIGYQLRNNSSTLPMSSIVYLYMLLFTSADGTHFVPANNDTSTKTTTVKNVCQEPINPFGSIKYYGNTSGIAAEVSPTASYLWSQYVITLGYSFNTTGEALALTIKKPVYIKAAPQADGSAIIDSTEPFVQDLPTAADGKIYIFLGIASGVETVELIPEHPVYYYSSITNSIQLYTGSEATTNIQIANKLQWKPIQDNDIPALQSVQIPDDATEIYILVFVLWTASEKICVNFHLPITGWAFNPTTGAATTYHVNYYGNNSNGFVRIHTARDASHYYVRLHTAFNGTTNVTSNTYCRMFYR